MELVNDFLAFKSLTGPSTNYSIILPDNNTNNRTDILSFHTNGYTNDFEYNVNATHQNDDNNDVLVNNITEKISNVSTSSSNACDESDDQALAIAFIVQGLALTIVSVLGLIGNVLSVITFARMRKKSSFTCLLLFLTLCDSILILTSIFIFGLHSIFDYLKIFKIYTNILYPLFVYYLYPVALIAQTGSVYFTCCLTLERCWAVCQPIKSQKSLWTSWKRGMCISFLILLFAFLFNIPRWYEYKVVMNEDGDSLRIATTELRDDPDFLEYYIHYAYFIVMYAVPMVMLIVVNSVIYRQIRKMNKTRQELTASQSQDNSLALILFGVVFVFLLCNALPLVNNVMELYYQCVSTVLVNWANFLVSLNSSINFLIYYVIGKRFRRYFKETILLKICCCFFEQKNQNVSRKTSSTEMWSVTAKVLTGTINERRRTFHSIPVDSSRNLSGIQPKLSVKSTNPTNNNNNVNSPNFRTFNKNGASPCKRTPNNYYSFNENLKRKTSLQLP